MHYLLLLFLISCEDDGIESNHQLVNSWQLAYYETSENGRINSPNDGKPVFWNLKADGVFEGMAGNNEIHGNYRVEGSNLVFTLFGSEIATTQWESRFYDALQHNWDGKAYRVPFKLDGKELILNYDDQETMHFVHR